MDTRKLEKIYQTIRCILDGEKMRLLDEFEANKSFKNEIFDSVVITYKNEQPEKMSLISRLKNRRTQDEASREWVEKEYLSAKSNMADLHTKAEMVSNLYNTLGKRKPNQLVEDMDLLAYYLFAGCKGGEISHEEMLSFLGTVFASNKKMRKDNDMMRLKELEELENYFDDAGNFLEVDNIEEVVTLFKNWFQQTNFNDYNLFTVLEHNGETVFCENVSDEDINEFIDFVREQVLNHTERIRVEKLERQRKKEQAIVDEKKLRKKQKEMKRSLHELRNYIGLDGTVVAPCDMAILPDLLKRCGLDEKTQKSYLNAMKKYFQAGESKETSIRNENLDKVCSEGTNESMVLFLNDEEGNPFVFSDIEAFDAGNRERVLEVFNKIRENRTAKATSTRPVYDGYALYNHTARIFFKELEPQVYLVMALNKNQSGYQTFGNRVQNSFVLDQISSIQQALKTDKREELIAENMRQVELLENALTKRNKGKEKKIANGNK